MTTPVLVSDFYDRLWNRGDEGAASDLLTADFQFRGSLGDTLHGHGAFLGYVRDVRASLSGYTCEIVACVAEADRAFARMRFSGVHTGTFLGRPPTKKRVAWDGAALFTFRRDRIAELWVLGDLVGLEARLRANALD
jgi:predicted ester cyclase